MPDLPDPFHEELDPNDYRPGIGVMLLNKDNHVFVGQRRDNAIDAWQMPQGGIDPNEDIEKAMWRELHEEIGVTHNHAYILDRSHDWIYYDLPEELKGTLWGGEFLGQRQIWFALKFVGQEDDIDIHHHEHPEFSQWKWVAPETLTDLIVPFKQLLYQQILDQFDAHL